MKIYKRDVVHFPFRSWTEYYTDKDLAEKAFDATDASNDFYVTDGGTSETDDIALYLYGRISNCNDYNNTAEQIRAKAF